MYADCHTISRIFVEWVPRDVQRNKGRPRKRCEDIFKETSGPDWRRQARDKERWRKLGEAYATEATSTCR